MEISLPNEKPEYIDEDRKEALDSVRETFPTDLDQFAPGSFGYFELIDRSMILYETWDEYILNHPSTVLNEEVYTLAHQINSLLHEFYQRVAIADSYAAENSEKVIFSDFMKWVNDVVNVNAGKNFPVEELVQKYLDRTPKIARPEN